MLKEVEGFILQEIPYKETSKIINVITKDYGLIGIIATGVKSIKSTLRAVSTKFTYGTFTIHYKKDKLSTLKSVDIIDELINIKTDLTLVSYASYISELILQIAKHEPSHKLYDLFINTILKINVGLDPLILTNILETKLLDFLGVGLNLDSCCKCQNTTQIVTIDGDVGGYICKNCLTDEIIVSPLTIKMLRMYYYVDISSITDLKISNKTKSEINRFLQTYYDRYTGLYLKSKNFLNKIVALEK